MSTLNTCTSSTRPASPSDGDMLYETDTHNTIIWDNSAAAWREYKPTVAPYILDSSNTLDVTPIIHLDAGKINGVDTSGNPSSGGDVPEWKSLVGTNSLQIDGSCDTGTNIVNKETCTLAGGTWTTSTAKMPVWDDGTGTGALNYKPYVYFYDDELIFKDTITAHGGYFLAMVVSSIGATSHVGTFAHYSKARFNIHTNYSGGWQGMAALVQRGNQSGLMNYSFNTPAGTYTTTNGPNGNAGNAMSVLIVDRPNMASGMVGYQDGNQAYSAQSYGQLPEWWNSFGDTKQYSYRCYLSEAIGFSTDNNLTTESHRVDTANKNKILSYLDSKYMLSNTTF